MAKIFFSYSHADEVLRNELEKHLSILKRQGLVETWHDRRIVAGSEIDHEISHHLEAADVILLLVSSDFLASDYCYDREMMRAMERHDSGQARVIPVILRSCHWHRAPFGKLLATPTDGKPVKNFPSMDDAFLDIVKAIEDSLNQLGKVPVPAPVSPLPSSQPTQGSMENPRSSNLRIKKEFSDLEVDRFQTESYVFIANFFETSLRELEVRNTGIQTDFRRIDANRFTAKVYYDGKQKCGCKVWLENRRSHIGGIAYSGNDRLLDLIGDDSYNEMIHVGNNGFSLLLRPLGMPRMGRLDAHELTMEGAAEYLWSLFLEPLQR